MKKRFKNQSLINMILSIVGAVAGYVISLTFIKYLGIDKYGLYSLLLTYSTLTGLVLNFGLTDLILRDSYLCKTEKIKNVDEIIKVTFILILVFIVVTLPFNMKIKNLFSRETNLYYLFLSLTFYLILKQILFSYLLSEKKSNLRNFLEQLVFKLFYIVLIYIYSKFRSDIKLMISIKILVELTIVLILMYKFKLINIRKRNINYLNKKNLVYSYYLMLHQVTEQGIFSIDKILIGKYLLIKDVGGYSFSMSLSAILMIIPSSIRSVKLPFFSEYIKEGNKQKLEELYKGTQLTMVYIVLPIVVTLVLYSKETLGIFNNELERYNITLIFLSLTSFSNIFFGFNGTIINMSSYFKFQFYSKIIFVVVIIISDIFLIKLYGVNGASIATFICFTFYNLLKTLLVLKKEKIHPFSKNLLNQGYAILVIFIISYYIKLNIKITLMILILQGFFQYLILFLFMTKSMRKKLVNTLYKGEYRL